MANICEVELRAKGNYQELCLLLDILTFKNKEFGELSAWGYDSDITFKWAKDKTRLSVYTGVAWDMSYVLNYSSFDFTKFSKEHQVNIEMMFKEAGNQNSGQIYIENGKIIVDERFCCEELFVDEVDENGFIRWAQSTGYQPATAEEYQAILDSGDTLLEYDENPYDWHI